MKRLSLLKIRPGTRSGLALAAAAIYAGSLILVAGADSTPADPKAADAKPADSKPAKKKAKKLGLQAGKEKGEEARRPGIVRHPLQSMPCGAVSHRIHPQPLENGAHAHARAGEPAGGPGQRSP
ncbi:exported hypothetical protein [Verrucomicrobia bacterium]|nr:exported hypothetical protein [Verrucomicrobiota bacterium]